MQVVTTQANFLKTIQDQTVTTNLKYSLSDFISNQTDFFIGKEGGPNKVGGDYYIGEKASEADYLADVRNARGYPTHPSPFRLRIKVAVLIDPSGPIVSDRPNYILINRKKYRRGLQRVDSEIPAGVVRSPVTGPITGPRQAARNGQKFFYADFPKGSASYEHCIIKDTSGDATGPLSSWPTLEKIILSTAYNEVREEARLSELDWKITGLYPSVVCEGHQYDHGIHKWNLFFIVYGTITDHIRLYKNEAQIQPRTSTLTHQELSDQLTDRASANLASNSLGKSFKERGTIQVVEIGVTDPKTWLQIPTHESLIYRDVMGLG